MVKMEIENFILGLNVFLLILFFLGGGILKCVSKMQQHPNPLIFQKQPNLIIMPRLNKIIN
jgi:hypothetical protein